MIKSFPRSLHRLVLIAAVLALSLGHGRAASRPEGIDSDFRAGTTTWTTVAGDGIQFACIKATALDEGLSNSVFSTCMNGAHAAGIYTIPYNRCDPALYEPKTEAQFFWHWASTNLTAGGYNLSPALDVEDGLGGSCVGDSGTTISLTTWCNEWYDDVSNSAAASGVHLQKIIYINAGSSCDLNATIGGSSWIGWTNCAYPYGSGAEQTGTPWCSDTGCEVWGAGTWTIWQWAWPGEGQGILPGLPEHVDQDVYNGTLAQMVAALGTTSIKPSFTQAPPATVTVNAGGTLVIPATVMGMGPLSYQWADVNGGTNVATGSTNANSLNATLTVSNVPASWNNDTLQLTVTNLNGSTNMTVALVVVSGLNANLVGPANLTLYAGQSFTYTAQATGTMPFYFQWYAGTDTSTPILNATNANYTAVAALGGSSYLCQVSNSFGGLSVTNLLATLTGRAAPVASYPQALLALHPADYWPLNETPDNGNGNQGVICHDYAGGNNGVYSNAVLAQAGYNPLADSTATSARFGTFFPTNCAISQIANLDFSAPAGNNAEFSVAAWVNGTGYKQTGNAGIVTKGYFNGEELDLDEGASGSDFRFEVRSAAGTAYNANSTINADTDSGWHQLVGVCDEAHSNVLLYIDGVQSGKAPIPALSGIINSASVPLTIGARAQSAASGNNQQFFGLIDDVAIYNYALSSNQVVSLYAAVPPPAINMGQSGNNNLMIGYSGTLLSATNATGPYSPVTGAAAPSYLIPTTNSQMFYRVRQP